MYIRYDPGVITQYVDLFRDHSQEHDVCISLEQKYPDHYGAAKAVRGIWKSFWVIVLLISFVFAIVVLFMKRHFTRLRYSAFVDDECFKYAFHEKLFSLMFNPKDVKCILQSNLSMRLPLLSSHMYL